MDFNFLFDIRNFLHSIGVEESYIEFLYHLVGIGFIVLAAVLSDLICRRVILTIIARIVRKTENNWDDIILERKVFNRLSHLAPAIVVFYSISFALKDFPKLELFLQHTVNIYMIIIITLVINSFLLALNEIYLTLDLSKNRSIKGYIQIVQIIVFSVAAIFVLSIMIGKSPMRLFAGLGAMAAVLILVFKDTILGLVASIQLSANHMVQIGDWITMDKYKADGIVTEITLNTVKVQNGDKTISTIPTYAMVSESFQNWRGMQESGGRRIKRFINIDMKSVDFCTSEQLEKFKKMPFIKEYIEEKQNKSENKDNADNITDNIRVYENKLTNLGVLRKYLEGYLKNHPMIHQEYALFVRQLQPTEFGIPIEIHAFSIKQDVINYENIQSEIFEHILAIIPEFDLRIFQRPSGDDFKG
jgi:miniconductance mechanosensitive channel